MKKLLAAVVLVALAPTVALAGPALAESPSLPSADRLSPYIKARLGDTANVGVRLCISAEGHVTWASVARSSTFKAFDNAVMTDLSDWRFESSDRVHCLSTTISYEVVTP